MDGTPYIIGGILIGSLVTLLGVGLVFGVNALRLFAEARKLREERESK